VVGRTKLIDIELSQPLQAVRNLESYALLRVVVRWFGVPLGEVGAPIHGGECSVKSLVHAIFPQLNQRLCHQLLVQQLLRPVPMQPQGQHWRLEELLAQGLRQSPTLTNSRITIAFLARSGDILESLNALQQLAYQNLEVLVIEVLPPDDRLKSLVQTQYPQFHYLQTMVPSWNAARNLAIEKAQGEIIAFTDPRGVVDRQWAQALANTFAAHPEVMAVTGWVLPAAIEQGTQGLMEHGYSVSRGDWPRWYRFAKPPTWMELGVMSLGSGMNMALRRSVCDRVGRFDLALDVPGSTWGGGDLEMWSRILLAGETLVYEPAALVRWRLPQTDEAAQTYLKQEIRGLFAFLAAARQRFPELSKQWATLGAWKLVRLCMAIVRNYGVPRLWIVTELKTALQSWGKYAQGLQQVAALPPNAVTMAPFPKLKNTAVRSIDIAQPIPDLLDVGDYAGVRVYLQEGSHLIGSTYIESHGATISRQRLATAIAVSLWPELLALAYEGNRETARLQADRAINDHWLPAAMTMVEATAPPQLSPQVTVSIIITTCDRPEDLQRCLSHLIRQKTGRSVEIIVADNRPASGLTPAVLAQFPQVRYVAEPRPGSSYGRNAAICASHGEIVVTVDDDVVVPSDWLEKLIAPLARPEVAAVTGNLLPLELETEAQHIFETLKGGLSQGWERFEVNQAWLDSQAYSPPTWNLGVSANAAFRASIFAEPGVGLMDEILGAGTPTGGGEENHLFYKLLRSGHTLVYEPDAYAWHKHRQTMAALCRQWHGYMRSATSYQLLLWLKEKDPRGRRHIFAVLPKYLRGYVFDRFKGKHQVPWPVVRSEVWGFLCGFWGYYQSVQRVKRLGVSQPYVPPAQRATQFEPVQMQPIVTPTMPPTVSPSSH
jgi:O-antigen biosynthesis protein